MLHFLFPSLCLHCEERSPNLVCKNCATFFELIDPLTRCPFCFTENEGRHACPECREKKRWRLRCASALDFTPPVQTVVGKMQGGQMPYLAKTAAAFMVMQMERLGWDEPDLFIPIPHHFLFPSTHLAKYLNGKVSTCLRRGIDQFYLKRGAQIEGKTVVLIDHVMKRGTVLQDAAEALREGFPKKIYALTYARALY